MIALEIIGAAKAEGVSLWVEAGRLRFRSEKPLLSHDLREMLSANRDAIIDELCSAPAETSPPSPPSPPETGSASTDKIVRLLALGDKFVAELGASGRHPKIAAAVEVVSSAAATGDLETVRHEIGEFLIVVREVASERVKRR